ncbi:MAG: hypothetical protein PUB86_00760 [Elusimicrobia bacterium]|nr:hypothetical protein [Elusimicrobiota bacterium]
MTKFIIAFFLFAGAVFAQAASYPLCMYGVNDAKYIKTIKKAGFNCVQTYSKDLDFLKTLAQEAKNHNVKIVIFPDTVIENDFQAEAANWPILAFYLYDEPDVSRVSWREVKKIDDKTKSAFPGHKTAVVVGRGSHAKNYCKSADILMIDWYPVPHLDLTSFGKQISEAKKIMTESKTAGKPLWGVVQSFDWREYKQYRPDDKRIGRFPTAEEMLFMAYHGLFEGAEGLFFFTFNSNSVPLPQSKPEYWKRVKKAAKELQKILPIFESGVLENPPIASTGTLKAQRRLYKGYYYDFLLNTSDVQEPLPEEFKQKTYKTLYRAKTETLAPRSVMILRSKAK